MTWWGKLIGTGVGMFGGPIGALVGAAFGHAYDKDNPEVTDEKKARVLYLAYFFSCLAKVAKADGRVSEAEINVAESLMARLGLSDKMREFSINVFRKAKDGKVPIDDYLAQTGKLIGFDSTVAQSFLGGLFEMARAEDGKMSELQARILLRGEECLRLPHGTVQSWVKGGYAPPADDPDGAAISLDESYHALDVPKAATDPEVKAAYRKKCAAFHPDKIQSKGLPPEFTTFANDQLARINQAHDLIRKARGIS